MFKDEYPATYQAVMTYLSRQKQAAANDTQRNDDPQEELPSAAPEPATFGGTLPGDAGVPPSAISVSLNIDIVGETASLTVTTAAPPSGNQHVSATVLIRSTSR